MRLGIRAVQERCPPVFATTQVATFGMLKDPSASRNTSRSRALPTGVRNNPSGNIRHAQGWVERIAQRADDISETAFDRLVGFGILDYDAGGFFSLSNKVARPGPQGCRDHWTGEHLRRIRSDAGAGGVRDRQGPNSSAAWTGSAARSPVWMVQNGADHFSSSGSSGTGTRSNSSLVSPLDDVHPVCGWRVTKFDAGAGPWG